MYFICKIHFKGVSSLSRKVTSLKTITGKEGHFSSNMCNYVQLQRRIRNPFSEYTQGGYDAFLTIHESALCFPSYSAKPLTEAGNVSFVFTLLFFMTLAL